MAKKRVRIKVALLVAVAALFTLVAVAQEQFAFMPKGGAQLLREALERCSTCDEVRALASEERAAEEWKDYLEEHEGALEGLSDDEVETLAHYLATIFPAEQVEDPGSLPLDGRRLVLENCQLCHTVAIPITQDRTVEQWLELVRVSPHDAVNLDRRGWELLAGYLAFNAPIPMEQIPPELRRGGAGY
jgi:hypothetical protein